MRGEREGRAGMGRSFRVTNQPTHLRVGRSQLLMRLPLITDHNSRPAHSSPTHISVILNEVKDLRLPFVSSESATTRELSARTRSELRVVNSVAGHHTNFWAGGISPTGLLESGEYRTQSMRIVPH